MPYSQGWPVEIQISNRQKLSKIVKFTRKEKKIKAGLMKIDATPKYISWTVLKHGNEAKGHAEVNFENGLTQNSKKF